MNHGLKPVWAGRDLRLDPFRLPQAVSYATADAHGDVHFTVSERGAVIRRTLPNAHLPVSIALPPRAFAGVAARAVEEDGEITVTLELHHVDPALCVPLLVAHDLNDVAADWKSWACAFTLPMLMIETDGTVTTIDDGSLFASEAKAQCRPARRMPGMKDRRPRLRARRKLKGLGVRCVVNGREIIARR